GDSCHQKCDDSRYSVNSGTTDALHVYAEIKTLLIKIAAPGEAGASLGQEEEFADSMGTPIRSAAVKFSSSRMRRDWLATASCNAQSDTSSTRKPFNQTWAECEETVQKNRQKLYGLEQLSDKLAQENNTLKNSLLDAFKARSFLLAASALLSGALCSLYGRLCAMSCQRDILQEQVNQQQLLNHKIVSLLYALPAVMERNQDEVRIRQRRAKSLAYVFRRAVIVALAANRLRGLARYSCTFFVWSDGCRGSPGIQVCLGESRGRHLVTPTLTRQGFWKILLKISHLEHTCKQKTDTMNNLLQNQEDAFKKMSEQFKAQEHLWQKEKQYLEEQYSNRLAEIQARAQECEEREQKNRQKLYGLEQMCTQLTQENNSMKNTLSSGHKECSPLLAACALLSGALCSLYGRLCTMPCQRDILQEQMNQHQLLNQKIISLLYALPTVVERNQDEGRLRQRRTKNLVYVFRRAVIAVLAANRLRALARYSCTFFVWTDGSRGSTGIQVCVGESRGRHPVPRFGEEGVDCMEALQWLTSSNLYTAIIGSISELQDVLNNQDAESWLSGHSLIGAARNCFAKLMDNLSVLMETVQRNACGYRPYLERDSLIQRLARGLQRVNAQALEAGLYDRLPSTRNIAILQQEIFGFLRRLHAAEVESHSLHLQLAECGWAFSEMQKDAEEACRLQEQLNELQRRINQDNIHKELDNALQHEHEAKLLLQEHQRRIQELTNTLELHSCANKDRSQVSNVPLMSLSNAAEELRREDKVLDHQNRLLKDTEQYRQRLQETLQEAERAIQEQGAIDEELIINHVKAVEATPNENMFRRLWDLYSLAAAGVEALRTGRQSSEAHVESEAAFVPLVPATDESSHSHIDSEAEGSPPPAPPPPPPPPPAPVAVPVTAPVPLVGWVVFCF
ncbi:hypothetical protein EK904_003857, partial [Melospiza melodia maxima]